MNKCCESIDFFWQDVKKITIQEEKIKKWIQQVINTEESTFGFINVIFCSDDYLLEMNKRYLNHDYYTDIITFDYNENDILNCDLFISLDSVNSNRKKFDIQFDVELNRVIVHGILHVIGYGDKTESEKKIMKKKENYYLEFLEKDNEL